MYVLCTYIYRNSCTRMYIYVYSCTCIYYGPCTYMFTTVCKLLNMQIHVCTMFRHVCTNLPIPVQVVRIPDAEYDTQAA